MQRAAWDAPSGLYRNANHTSRGDVIRRLSRIAETFLSQTFRQQHSVSAFFFGAFVGSAVICFLAVNQGLPVFTSFFELHVTRSVFRIQTTIPAATRTFCSGSLYNYGNTQAESLRSRGHEVQEVREALCRAELVSQLQRVPHAWHDNQHHLLKMVGDKNASSCQAKSGGIGSSPIELYRKTEKTLDGISLRSSFPQLLLKCIDLQLDYDSLSLQGYHQGVIIGPSSVGFLASFNAEDSSSSMLHRKRAQLMSRLSELCGLSRDHMERGSLFRVNCARRQGECLGSRGRQNRGRERYDPCSLETRWGEGWIPLGDHLHPHLQALEEKGQRHLDCGSWGGIQGVEKLNESRTHTNSSGEAVAGNLNPECPGSKCPECLQWQRVYAERTPQLQASWPLWIPQRLPSSKYRGQFLKGPGLDKRKVRSVRVSVMLLFYEQPEEVVAKLVEGFARCVATQPRWRFNGSVDLDTELLVNVDQPSQAVKWVELWYDTVHDNRSGDSREGEPFMFIRISHNLHENRGYNMMARAAQGEVLLVSQDDDLAPSNCTWLPRVVNQFEAHPRLGAVGLLGGVIMPGATVRGNFDTHFDLDLSTGELASFVYMVDVGYMAVLRSVWIDTGGYDESWSKVGETGIMSDWDLMVRLWRAGYSVQHLKSPEHLGLGKSIAGHAGTHNRGTLSAAVRSLNGGVNAWHWSRSTDQCTNEARKEIDKMMQLGRNPGLL